MEAGETSDYSPKSLLQARAGARLAALSRDRENDDRTDENYLVIIGSGQARNVGEG